MAKYASKVVAQAQSWLGYNENDGSHKKIIDIYNSHKPLARGYAVKYNDAWCATFVSAVAIKLGYTDIIPTECGCPSMITLMQKMGIWIENENRVPNAGDIIFYDWQDNGAGDNKGSSDHVGIVERVEGNNIIVIEGNYSNSVKRRTLSVNGRYIRGYGVPKYDSESVVVPSVTVNSATNRIDTTKEVQNWANTNYNSGLVVDGIYGKNTKKALVKILQTELNQTYKANLVVDGIWGAKTKAACPSLKAGIKNDVVGVLQALLICNGYTGAYLDKDYGSATTSAVKSYQSKKGLVTDGIAGKNTFAKLCD
jgi:hypothetical protein